MKKKIFLSFILVFVLAIAVFSFTGKGKERRGENNIIIQNMVFTMPYESLSPLEKSSLLKMREEEKLARDIYLALYETWGIPVFNNISDSEQKHMDAVKSLIIKYGLNDSVINDKRGEFTNPELKKLYEKLVEQGKSSIAEALKVGAIIEDLDIYDIDEAILKSDNTDIVFVFGNLRKGSENHMRAFIYQLNNYGISYTPQYISQEEFNKIKEGNHNSGQGNGRGRGRRKW
jgi:hypothetical protein